MDTSNEPSTSALRILSLGGGTQSCALATKLLTPPKVRDGFRDIRRTGLVRRTTYRCR
jgi:hypothetical protein